MSDSPPSRLGELASKAIVPAIDKVVELRYDPMDELVARLTSRHPNATPSEVADEIIRRYRKELGTVGAATGGTAAMPGTGTSVALGLGFADVSWTTARLGEMIMALGIAYGHSAEEIEIRRAWILAVLGMAMGAASALESAVPGIAGKGGAKLVSAIPISQIVRINQLLGGRIIVKYGEKQGVIKLGKLAPFGIGAALGGGGNVLLVRAVGNRGKDFFDDGAEPPFVSAAAA